MRPSPRCKYHEPVAGKLFKDTAKNIYRLSASTRSRRPGNSPGRPANCLRARQWPQKYFPMLASAQTGSRERTTIASMFSRLGNWWQLGITLTVMWTVVVSTYGWMNLPRAQQLPHDPHFLSNLSQEATSILFGSEAQAEPARGTLVWSQAPMLVRMSNGTRLKFPAPTTDERAAIVASEYRQLLNVEAEDQRGPYLLRLLAIWLAPWLLVAGLALSQSGLFRIMFASEQSKPPQRVTIA